MYFHFTIWDIYFLSAAPDFPQNFPCKIGRPVAKQWCCLLTFLSPWTTWQWRETGERKKRIKTAARRDTPSLVKKKEITGLFLVQLTIKENFLLIWLRTADMRVGTVNICLAREDPPPPPPPPPPPTLSHHPPTFGGGGGGGGGGVDFAPLAAQQHTWNPGSWIYCPDKCATRLQNNAISERPSSLSTLPMSICYVPKILTDWSHGNDFLQKEVLPFINTLKSQNLTRQWYL